MIHTAWVIFPNFRVISGLYRNIPHVLKPLPQDPTPQIGVISGRRNERTIDSIIKASPATENTSLPAIPCTSYGSQRHNENRRYGCDVKSRATDLNRVGTHRSGH